MKLPVSSLHHGLRIDRYLAKQAPSVPWSVIQRLLREGSVRSNEKLVRNGHRVLQGDEIDVRIQNNQDANEWGVLRKDEHVPEPLIRSLRNRILHEDSLIAVFDKPRGYAVQSGTGLDTSLDRVLPKVLDSDVFLVHRLDRGTTGCLAVAKHRDVAAELSQSFKDRQVGKLYAAVVNRRPVYDQGRIWMSVDGKLHSSDQSDQSGKEVTDFRVLSGNGGRWNVVFEPHSGRKHQIRRHAQGIGSSIVGDQLYGESKGPLLLHAWRLVLPVRGVNIRVEAPIPFGDFAGYTEWPDSR